MNSLQLDILPPANAPSQTRERPTHAQPPALSREEAGELNHRMEHWPAEDIIHYAVQRFPGQTAVTSSFGADSAIMLHLATRVCGNIPVLAVNTGFLFPQTLDFAARLQQQLGLNLQWHQPVMTSESFVAEHGPMWKNSPDACCAFNKREPFLRAKQGLKAWMTGIRREQSITRRRAPIVSVDDEGLAKFCPIANWTARDIHAYLTTHNLPYHPLREEGYLSIGCTHCTRRVQPGEDARAGRWAGFDKTECGLHTFGQGDGI